MLWSLPRNTARVNRVINRGNCVFLFNQQAVTDAEVSAAATVQPSAYPSSAVSRLPPPASPPLRLTGRCAARLRPPVMKSKRLSPRALTGRSVVPLFRYSVVSADSRYSHSRMSSHTRLCRYPYNECAGSISSPWTELISISSVSLLYVRQ